MGLVQPDPILVCDGDTAVGFCIYGAELEPECAEDEGWTVDGDIARCFACAQHEAAAVLPEAEVHCLEGRKLNGDVEIYKFATEKRDLATWSGPFKSSFKQEQYQSLRDAHRSHWEAFADVWPRVATAQEAEEW